MKIDLKECSMEDVIAIRDEAEKQIRNRSTLSINGRISYQKAMHKNSCDKKAGRLEKYKETLDDERFESVLETMRPMQKRVVRAYLKTNTTWQSVSLDLNITSAEAQRYFKETMQRIKKILEEK